MAPGIQVDPTQNSWAARPAAETASYTGPPRNVETIDAVQFDKKLQPKKYEIAGTSPDSKILLTDVNILDSTGREPYRGDVFVEGVYCPFCLRSFPFYPSSKTAFFPSKLCFWFSSFLLYVSSAKVGCLLTLNPACR